ncbi:MAG: radical SAM family heme chaperone HemW [Clostridia bacterium]|nr:radical SAM family heme chaperone HemW [Clostridia bacterium]
MTKVDIIKLAGIYIHIPFCVRKCLYCDFFSVPASEDTVAAYTDALCLEMQRMSWVLPEREYDTVFLGGGTPSILTPEQIQTIMRTLRTHFSVRADAEISMECNPGTVTEEKLSGYREAGINRLSVGMQSSDDGLLKRIGRIHTEDMFFGTVSAMKACGFDNFSVDIMQGLPGQTEEQYLETIRAVAGTGAKHISSYSLILEEGTPLYGMVGSGAVRLPGEDETADMEGAGSALLARLGFSRYEISNFAKEGYRCRHNLNYWKNGEYAGFGPGAHSAMHRPGWTRWNCPPDIPAYLSSIRKGDLPAYHSEQIGKEEEMFETVMTGLRLCEGVPFEAFRLRFGRDLPETYPYAIGKLKEAGWLDTGAYAAGRLALNAKGLDLQNRALSFFLER